MRGLVSLFVVVLIAATGYSLYRLWDDRGPIGSEHLIGRQPPPFAAPLASSGLRYDSNIYTEKAAELAGAKSACEVRRKGVFNSCRDLTGDAAIVFWNPTREKCVAQVSRQQQAFAASPNIDQVAVAFNAPIERVAPIVTAHRWRPPVAVDRDGAVAALYSVAGCPSTFFVRDGRISDVKLGSLSVAELRRAIKSNTRG